MIQWRNSVDIANQYTIRGISQNEEGQIINGMRTRQHYFLQPLTSKRV
jgi:iron complex outermembrane receptor protein